MVIQATLVKLSGPDTNKEMDKKEVDLLRRREYVSGRGRGGEGRGRVRLRTVLNIKNKRRISEDTKRNKN